MIDQETFSRDDVRALMLLARKPLEARIAELESRITELEKTNSEWMAVYQKQGNIIEELRHKKAKRFA